MTLRVAAFTAGPNVSCARFRVHQYRAPLAEHAVTLDVFPARLGAFPPRARILRPVWGPATLAQRLPAIARSHGYDVTLLQRELVSTLMTLEPWTGRPRVLDVDDAIWLHQRARGVDRIARAADAVICGNAFLADYFGRLNARVRIVPTGVDTALYRPADRAPGDPVIGWTGTSSNFRYLEDLVPVLADVLAARPAARFRVVADRAPALPGLPAGRVEFVRWRPDNEAAAVQGMTMGIMPLRDTEWERGKCSHKMVLYMAAGIPAVVSPVGMNRDVLAMGPVGLAASTAAEWREALLTLVDEPDRAVRMGRAGRDVAVRVFDVRVIAGRLAEILYEVAGNGAGTREAAYAGGTDGGSEVR